MRTLFLAACVIAGLFAGLWWTGISPATISSLVAASREAVVDEPAATDATGSSARTVLPSGTTVVPEPSASGPRMAPQDQAA